MLACAAALAGLGSAATAAAVVPLSAAPEPAAGGGGASAPSSHVRPCSSGEHSTVAVSPSENLAVTQSPCRLVTSPENHSERAGLPIMKTYEM